MKGRTGLKENYKSENGIFDFNMEVQEDGMEVNKEAVKVLIMMYAHEKKIGFFIFNAKRQKDIYACCQMRSAMGPSKSDYILFLYICGTIIKVIK